VGWWIADLVIKADNNWRERRFHFQVAMQLWLPHLLISSMNHLYTRHQFESMLGVCFHTAQRRRPHWLMAATASNVPVFYIQLPVSVFRSSRPDAQFNRVQIWRIRRPDISRYKPRSLAFYSSECRIAGTLRNARKTALWNDV